LADPNAVPRLPGWTVDGHLVRTADGAPLPGALQPARRVNPSLMRTPETTVNGTNGNGQGTTPSGGPVDERDALLHEFLRNSREMVAAQRDVLISYFGGSAGVAPPGQVVSAAPPMPELVATVVEAVAPVVAPPAVVEAATVAQVEDPAPVAEPASVDVLQTVLAVIAERTGYPVEMIEPDLDLEADLSVDSIKRTEIAGELGRRLLGSGVDLRSLPDAELEELTRARTAEGIAQWLRPRVGGAPAAATAPAPAVAPAPVS
ncbi:acyl carrier protein, partial [Streptomyces sp. T-3]|nr:acyl carrier protein [Streptomyces sp. T-3]